MSRTTVATTEPRLTIEAGVARVNLISLTHTTFHHRWALSHLLSHWGNNDWLINVTSEGLNWHHMLWQSILHQTLHVRLSWDTQTIQSNDWLKWCCATPNIISHALTDRLSIGQLFFNHFMTQSLHTYTFYGNLCNISLPRTKWVYFWHEWQFNLITVL